ncbi:UNVERIFIED_CONTAM: ATPase, AAA family protein [Hammondia hammondi]|eukprot:XP_008885136.1 ATPase, AAA family protein [Hammondia hammondi]
MPGTAQEPPLPSSSSSPPPSSSSSPSSSPPPSSSSPPPPSSSSSPPPSSSSPSSSPSSSSSPESPPPSGSSFSWTSLVLAGAYGGSFALGALLVPSLFAAPSSSAVSSPVSLIPDASLASLSSSLGALSSPPVPAPFSHFLRLLSSSSLKTVALIPLSPSLILYSPHPDSSSSFSSSSLLSSLLPSAAPPASTSPVSAEGLRSESVSPFFLTRALPGSEQELSRLLMNNKGVELLHVFEENACSHALEASASLRSASSVWASLLDELLEVALAFAGLAALSALLFLIGRHCNLLPSLPPGAWASECSRELPAFSRVTFADVAGHEDAKRQLRQIIQFLKTPHAFDALGARAPRGVLLEGPSGTGKTLLARAVAGEAGVPFLSFSGGAFVELFVGQGASRVRALFDAARARAPCVVFIDEFDAIAFDRKECGGGSSQEYLQTVNELLYQLDGMQRPSGGGRAHAGLSGASACGADCEKSVSSENGEAKPRSLFASLKRTLAPLFALCLPRSTSGKGAPGAGAADSPSSDSSSDSFPPLFVVLAATNRVSALDEAIKRPGRFDQVVHIGLPSEEERLEALRLHSAPLVLAASVDLRPLARDSQGLSGADLACLCNDAALRASRAGRAAVAQGDFEAALETLSRRSSRSKFRARPRQRPAADLQNDAREPAKRRDVLSDLSERDDASAVGDTKERVAVEEGGDGAGREREEKECASRDRDKAVLHLMREWVRVLGERDMRLEVDEDPHET